MSSLVIIHIGFLVGVRKESTLLRGAALANLPVIEDAFLYIEHGLIRYYGPMDEIFDEEQTADRVIDAT